ncbi:MAG: zinc ribbon domain-containing protein [Desulfovibrio sp.]|jgi:putative FmdB family regulatory protein|nr:zinc ribbon domain-containing protein [Desulfovibrio sp.]
MPIYEYLCPKCNKIFEEWTASANDDMEEPCPRCAASASRVISQTSFVLKGDGWYVSDYGYRKGVKENCGEAPSAENKDAGKTDAAVAQKPSVAVSDKTKESGKAEKAKIPPKPAAARQNAAAP